MSKKNLVNLVSSTNASNGNTALTGKENVMSENISSTPASSVYFRDSSDSWWETCTAGTEGAEAFGPRGCAVRSTPPEWLSGPKTEGEWEVYLPLFRFPCIGCKGELLSEPSEFCSTCEVDGTEFTLRGGYDVCLSDKVDQYCKGSSFSDEVDAQCKGWDEDKSQYQLLECPCGDEGCRHCNPL
jgi:hypothetical protein